MGCGRRTQGCNLPSLKRVGDRFVDVDKVYGTLKLIMGMENLGSSTESGPMDTFHGVAHALVSTFEGIDSLGEPLSPDVSDKIAALMGKLEQMPGQLHGADF